MKDEPIRPDSDACREFLRTARPRLREIFRRYGIPEDDAVQILCEAWVGIAWSGKTFEERCPGLAAVIDNACREARAQWGPEEEQEDDPFIH